SIVFGNNNTMVVDGRPGFVRQQNNPFNPSNPFNPCSTERGSHPRSVNSEGRTSPSKLPPLAAHYERMASSFSMTGSPCVGKYALRTYCCTMRCVLKNDPLSAMAW